MKYMILATYTLRKQLEVEVAEGDDPKDPGAWKEIEWEHDEDCYITDVISAEPSEEGG